MKTLLKAVEIWVPDADGQLLELEDGLYGGAKAFGMLSRTMCFGRGEGLPGRVWEEGRPILLKDLQTGYFRRAAAAAKAQLTCAVAVPVFSGDSLKAVVVFFCGDDGEEAGAIELWRNDPRVTTDMTLVDGCYGLSTAGGERLSVASGDTFLPRGAGLPGLAWQRQASVFMDDLTDPAKFVRAEEAAAAGMRRGLAIPCPLPTNENYAVAFLASAARPFAKRIESWRPDAAGTSLRREFGFDETEGRLPATEVAIVADDPKDTLSSAFRHVAPRVTQGSGAAPSNDDDIFADLSGMLAMPVFGDGAVTEVLALYF